MCGKLQCFSEFFMFVGFLGLVCGLVYSLYVLPLLESNFYGQTALKNGTQAFQNFQNISFPISVSIFVFNITNSDEMENGEKAKVEEIGPYVYNLERLRIINNTKKDDEDGILNYYEINRYKFDSAASGSRSEEDLITIIHIPYITLGKLIVKNMNDFTNVDFMNLLYKNFPGVKYPVLTATFKEIFFTGLDFKLDFYNSNLNKLLFNENQKIHRIVSYRSEKIHEEEKEKVVNYLRFSLLKYKNGFKNGPYKIHSGAKDPEIQGNYVSYGTTNRQGTVGYFTQYCAQLNGTNLFNFPPTQLPPKRMYSHFSDLCRSIFFQFEQTTNKVYGFPTTRYKISDNLLDQTKKENKCFCSESLSETPCKKISGIINLEECKKIPIVVSYPHFYLAEPSLNTYVDGIETSDTPEDSYSSYFDIEPSSATPIFHMFRFQINYLIDKIPNLEAFHPEFNNLTDGIFPIYWTEEKFTLTDRVINFFVETHKFLGQLRQLRYIVIFTSIGVMFLAVLIPLCQKIRSEYKEIKEREAQLLSDHKKIYVKNQKTDSFPFYN